jgi:hypothetical protein
MVLEQRKTILKVFLSCVSSQKKNFTELEKRKYRNGIFTELCLTRARAAAGVRGAPLTSWRLGSLWVCRLVACSTSSRRGLY